MRRLYIILFLTVVFFGCHDVTIGYLKADEAEYDPATLTVRTVLDPEEDELRIANDANWVSPKIQGVLGTNPLIYTLENVTATEGGDAEAFRKEVIVRGAGVMELPLYTKVPKGNYLVSVRVSNEGYSAVIEDAFTFIVE